MIREIVPIIKKEDLQHGKYYSGSCRNASIARWNGDKQKFYHWREKHGYTFIEPICCPEDDEFYDVFVAEQLIENVEKEIPFGD